MRSARSLSLMSALFVATIGMAACGGSGYSPAGSDAANPQIARGLLHAVGASGSSKIQHVVIVIQENRSFDNLFQAFPGADTQSYGYDSSGDKITLGQVPLEAPWDIAHESASFFAACNGLGSYPGTDCQMNGFNKEYVYCGHSGQPSCPFKDPTYAYVPPSETKLYFEMGQQYVVGDQMFASNFDASSFVAHQYLIAAQAASSVNLPSSNEWGCYGGPSDVIATVTLKRVIDENHRERVCFNYQTLGDELDAAGFSWRYYTAAIPNGDGHIWNAYAAVKHIYQGPDWKNDVISPQTQFFTDVSKGKLPAVSWITPTCENSDHASCDSNTGPSWVASIVNAIGQSQYWNSTAIFVTWDDYGGWYDHVPPKMLDYDGLGFRVPLIVVSPYAKQGYVSHVHYELASLLRFVEDRFGLKTLSASDARATDPAGDCFNFSQSPRKFKVIQAKRGRHFFMHQPLDLRPVDSE